MKTAPDPKDVQEFQFKQASVHQVFDAFKSVPGGCNLLAADKKRGLLYIGYENKIVIFKPGEEGNPEWKIQVDLPVVITKLALSSDCSYLAVAPLKPAVLIYNVQILTKNSLKLLHEVRISSSTMSAVVRDLRWNPGIPGMLCTVASDHTIGIYQIKEEKENTISIKALERLEELDALCAAWSPKGKQIVIGCKNGNIIQLKPDLKVARTIPGPFPYIGEVITILWISSYQFCAAYLNNEQHINVLIVDAPKGETNAIFTCYEDITYGMPEAEGGGNAPSYYFDHVAEWGLIIAASSGSSEIAVLGTTDGGGTWSQWQLIDSGRAQLPLIKTTESYPVGLAIDRSPINKLPWGTDSTLPHPVPILHIFGTSGQLCSFHMVNLTPNCPAINSPPTEIVTVPTASRPSVTPSEISFTMNGAATSTPRPKQTDIFERTKPAPVANIFGNSLKNVAFFQQHQQQQQQPQNEVEQPKPQEEKPPLNLPIKQEIKPMSAKETILSQPAKGDIKVPSIKEAAHQEVVEQKPSIDDHILCMRVYLEEQSLFEKELRSRLEPQVLECGTEEERKQLRERSDEIDQFLRDLKDTTNSLSSDIAYLKALLLQSFAWVEETKSKNAASADITTRSCTDSSKIADLQRLYYYTQSQLTQATKIFDLEWSDYKAQEKSRMKIPSLEFVYQNLVLHNDIIRKEKSKLESLAKKWKTVSRLNNITGINRSMTNMHITSPKSTAVLRGNTGVIEARCKTIASKTLSFTQGKQMKLRNLLTESSPRIIKPVNPSPVQDRLEATLSSLASLSPVTSESKIKLEKPVTKQNIVNKQVNEKNKPQSPLASLNSIVARIGSSETNGTLVQNKGKSPPVAVSFPSVGTKLPQTEKKPSIATPSTVPQPKQKQDNAMIFSQTNSSVHALSGLPKSTKDTINFGAPLQKPQETFFQKTPPKDLSVKSNKDAVPSDTPKTENTLFSSGSLKDVLSSEFSTKQQGNIPALSVSTVAATTKSDAAATFCFATPNSVAKVSSTDAALTQPTTVPQVFSFATKPSKNFSFASKPTQSASQQPPLQIPSQAVSQTPSQQSLQLAAQQLAVQKPLDLMGLSLGLQPSEQSGITSNTDVKTVTSNKTKISLLKFQQSTMQVFSTSSTSTTTVGGLSISVVIGNAARKPPETSTPSLTIEELSTTEANTPIFKTTTTQVQTATTSAPLFGQATATPFSSPILGSAVTSTPATTSFGISSTPSSTTSPIFGPQTSASTISTFSEFSVDPSIAATTSVAAPTTSATSPFYSSLPKPTFSEAPTSLPAPSFTGVNSSPTTTLTFDVTATTPPSITPAFGKTSTSPTGSTQFPSTTTASSTSNIFRKPVISPASTPFVNAPNTSVFGNMSPAASTSPLIFGRNTNSIFGGNASSTTGSIFGGNASMTGFATGGTGSVFDNNAAKPAGLTFSSNTGSNLFGGTASNTSPPAVGGSATGTPPIFSGGANNASPMVVGGSQPVLGVQTAFGQAPTFGTKPVFGSTPSMFGGGFETSTFGANATAGAAFGNSPDTSAAPSMDNMSKVFGNTAGSSTFESLANQAGGLTFGSLAQKSPEPEKPVFSAGSSFSNWR